LPRAAPEAGETERGDEQSPQSGAPGQQRRDGDGRGIAAPAQLGGLREVGLIDQQGHLFVSGTLDLAMLAHVTELALRGEFAALSGAPR
jgi:hypothetical protein